MVAKFPQILQGLEYMLLSRFAFRTRCIDSIGGGNARFRFPEVVVEVLLKVRKLAVVVLNNFGR